MARNAQKAREFLEARRLWYHQVFDNEHGKNVLRDLAKFCRANETTYHPQMGDVLNGRREVWLRIQQHLNLSDDDLWNLLDGRTLDD